MPEQVRAFFQEQGRIGGKISGKVKNPRKGFGSMSPERAKEIRAKAVESRLKTLELRLGHPVGKLACGAKKRLLTPRP